VCLVVDESQRRTATSYVASTIKYLHMNAFHSLKIDALKPKSFEPECSGRRCASSSPIDRLSSTMFVVLDEMSTENDWPILIRVNLSRHGSRSAPVVTVKLEHRHMSIGLQAIDILLKNLEQIPTDDEKKFERARRKRYIPLVVHLNDLRLSVEVNRSRTCVTCNLWVACS
jgi:hypothetical protein